MDKVELFIKDFKDLFAEALEFTFYHGYCYWFAYILAARFKGEIWFNPTLVHFATYIDEDLYDIYGKIEPGRDPITGEYDERTDDWVSWEEYQYCNSHDKIESIVSSCIKKERDNNEK